MSFRDIKFAARRVVHDTMAQPAMFYSDPGTSEPVAITARPHSKRGQIGDLAGTNLNYAEDFDRKERVIFWRDQLAPIPGVIDTVPPRGALVIFATDEGYFVDSVEPPDGQTITAEVTRAMPEDLAGHGLVAPDGTEIP